MSENKKNDIEKAADIIRLAGGEVIGRTRFQKIAYLLEIAGAGCGFSFEYRHYGPYSEQLADAASKARIFGVITEVEKSTEWGGWYSVFTTAGRVDGASPSVIDFVETASKAKSVELELAATAVFFALLGERDPWGQTASRKPDKANSIEAAKRLYYCLQVADLPKRLPSIP